MKQILLILAAVVVGCGKKEAVDKKPLTQSEIIEAAIRKAAKKPTGELTKADVKKVVRLYLNGYQLTDLAIDELKAVGPGIIPPLLHVLYLDNNQLTEVPKGLEKLTRLRYLILNNNQLTDLKGLEKLTQLTVLNLINNPDLTEAQIDKLQKALPKCWILHSAKK